jgi:hypothetical protein
MTAEGIVWLAVGGGILLLWSAISWRRADRRSDASKLAQLKPGTADYGRIARAAMAAELREGTAEDLAERLAMMADPVSDVGEAGVIEGEELVCIYVAANSIKASMVCQFLSKHRIRAVTGEVVGSGDGRFEYDEEGLVRVMVPARAAGQARLLIRKSF